MKSHPAVNWPETEGGEPMSSRPWVERAIKPGTERTTELYAYLPYENGSNRYWLREVLGNQVRLTTVQRNGCTAWKIGREHMLPLAAAMADEYGEIELRLEVSKTMQCDTNCKDANPYTVFRCVCACGGENHGGVGRYEDWYRAGRTTLLRNDKTEVKQAIITRAARSNCRSRAPTSPAPRSHRSHRRWNRPAGRNQPHHRLTWRHHCRCLRQNPRFAR
ncbi:hypothetical protein AB0B25_30155 [Nocardia sp. NPDC049190]|uniref:hypothetical protein n=1 Tax=Nocardia sp. NPDC049190 TaxID=3155650 RepID=UPI0033F8F737